MKKIYSLLFLIFVTFINGQELRATVTVNYDKLTNVNPQIFKNLQSQVSDFLNNTKFSDKNYVDKQRVNCNFFFIVNSFVNNDFEVSLQVSSTREIFNSSYQSPVLNINDNDVAFRYIEFENLNYDPNGFSSNLVSVLGFYANLIIGVDKDTFDKNASTENYERSNLILNAALSSGYSGWAQSPKKPNRGNLIADFLSSTFQPYREALYTYHLSGLDEMIGATKKGKEQIEKSNRTGL